MKEEEYRETLVGKTAEELGAEVSGTAGLPAYRGKQLAEWLYRKMEPGQNGGINSDFQTMTDLPQAARDTLASLYSLSPLRLHEAHQEPRDGTVKLLVRVINGNNPIECVLLPDERRV